jgi:hypothetical protein
MKQRRRIYYSSAQRSEIWDRWQAGGSMSSIGRRFDRESSSVFSVISPTGGIRPPVRQRPRQALSLPPSLTLMGSVAVYFAGRHFGWNLAASPSGFWYFNPFSWQLLFFLGAWIVLGGAEAIQSVIRNRTMFWLAISYLAFACVVTIAVNDPDLGSLLLHWMLAPFDPNDKTNLAPYRVGHLIALAVVVTRFLRLDSPMLQWRPLALLILCGLNSLLVFCIGIVLSFCAHAAIKLSLNAVVVQIIVGAAGMLLMTAVAYWRTWSKVRDYVFASPVRIGELA